MREICMSGLTRGRATALPTLLVIFVTNSHGLVQIGFRSTNSEEPFFEEYPGVELRYSSKVQFGGLKQCLPIKKRTRPH